ncbi:hypothetical protein RRX38_14940 [Pseudomonas sp. DTU_2021_1001937_2_SI_NGA_ILE_001]|uniref:hypothetical protein n=1 Tax=Pseudomonas sp. DTU_2021_1001937_2_SI_NGA_ILE_001 TaxID=3077589 RepID=UPI0028FC1141|nr:hypothetical protein [Pseudomonas sp. DTU_2021_1001937_2_SI_NGA_ILE_001]WNW12389.1 hypothetical protein RRX38_14940 [Pseudomonas sp. DTU_2021_1001937_2_SI_NGA_ILE_001]
MSHPSCIYGQPKLAAPDIPQTCRHGIGIRLAPRLLVQIPVYPDMDEGDLIELFWNDCYVASKILSASDLHQPVALRVPESFLQNGKARASYRVMKVGGTPQASACRKLWVKLDAPGGALLGPDEAENQGLAPLSLPASVLRRGITARHRDSGLPLSIEPYPNMAPHDEITLRWGDTRMDLPPLRVEEIGEPVEFVVPPALLRETGDEPSLEATYCIIDRVGNNSSWAPPREIPLHDGDD